MFPETVKASPFVTNHTSSASKAGRNRKLSETSACSCAAAQRGQRICFINTDERENPGLLAAACAWQYTCAHINRWSPSSAGMTQLSPHRCRGSDPTSCVSPSKVSSQGRRLKSSVLTRVARGPQCERHHGCHGEPGASTNRPPPPTHPPESPLPPLCAPRFRSEPRAITVCSTNQLSFSVRTSSGGAHVRMRTGAELWARWSIFNCDGSP